MFYKAPVNLRLPLIAIEENKQKFATLPEDTKFFLDCNYPGEVYWTLPAEFEAARENLLNEGGNPSDLSKDDAFVLVTEHDPMENEFPWGLKQWRLF